MRRGVDAVGANALDDPNILTVENSAGDRGDKSASRYALGNTSTAP
jgi:hypothetical protein